MAYRKDDDRKTTADQRFREGTYSTPQGRQVYNNSKTRGGRSKGLGEPSGYFGENGHDSETDRAWHENNKRARGNRYYTGVKW